MVTRMSAHVVRRQSVIGSCMASERLREVACGMSWNVARGILFSICRDISFGVFRDIPFGIYHDISYNIINKLPCWIPYNLLAGNAVSFITRYIVVCSIDDLRSKLRNIVYAIR